MPQMMPMLWTLMLTFLMFILISITSLIYFQASPIFPSLPPFPLKLSKWNWKW